MIITDKIFAYFSTGNLFQLIIKNHSGKMCINISSLTNDHSAINKFKMHTYSVCATQILQNNKKIIA